MRDLRGKVVMITGASEGLGLALARGFSSAGARVSICARRTEPLQAALRQLVAAPAIGVAADVSDESAVTRWLEQTMSELGAPEVLINNASILGPRVPLSAYPIDAWKEVVNVNLNGAFVATRTVLPSMLERGRGSIVNVSSGAAVPPRALWGAYAVSKDALEGLTLNLAAELRGSGIRVNAVDPGAMRTRMRSAAYPDEDPRSLKEAEDILPLFLWLASDDTRVPSGERILAERWIEEHREPER